MTREDVLKSSSRVADEDRVYLVPYVLEVGEFRTSPLHLLQQFVTRAGRFVL
jgi:hypothetical protein